MLKKKRRKVVDVNLKCDIANEIYHQAAQIAEIKVNLEILKEEMRKMDRIYKKVLAWLPGINRDANSE